MPPRFMERMQRQSATYKSMFGEPQFDPPPYPFSRSRGEAVNSTMSGQSGQFQDQGKPLPPPPQYYQVDRPTAVGFDKPALPRNSLVLITGANGWQGMHIVDQLLEHGNRLRGTVRDAEKAVATAKYFSDKYGPGKYTTAVIPDMAVQGAFEIAARGHPIIPPSIAGAINALEAAAKEPNIKRFVYCSASAAAVSQGTRYHNEVTHESWNMAAFKTAWQPPPYEVDRAFAVFASSKMQTEQAVWRWYLARGPHFVLNTVLPNVLWGKMLDSQVQGIRTSVAQLKLIFDGNAAATARAPPQYFVDVQDSALLHVAALILPDVRGRESLLRGLYPDRAVEGDVSDHGVDLTTFKETSKAEDLLMGMGRAGWTDIETSINRNCEAFL